MELKKRTNGIYMLVVKHPKAGKRLRLSTGQREKTAAEREARRILADLDSGKLDGVRFRDVIWHTYREKWAGKKSAGTFFKRCKLLDALVLTPLDKRRPPYPLADLIVSEVKYPVLVDMVNTLRERGDLPATINRKLSMVSVILKEAKKLEYLSNVPPIPKQQEDNQKDRYLSDDEEARLLAACLRPPDRTLHKPGYWLHRWRLTATYMRRLLEFLLDTGARLGEAQRLEPRDIQQHPDGSWTVSLRKTKNGKSRAVPLTPRALKAARKLVVHPLHGKVDTTGLISRFNRIRRRAGVSSEVTLHTMRHTCASRLVQRGVSLIVVRDWLGHSSIVVTERYAHLRPQESVASAMHVLCREPLAAARQ